MSKGGNNRPKGVFYKSSSAARKVDIKIINLLLKVAQKVATPKNWYKTSLKQVFSSFKCLHIRLYKKVASKPV